MKEHPIIFRAEMVRAILAGRKTQTRRIVKPRKDRAIGCELACHELAGEVNAGDYLNAPWAPGDWLWVRESIHMPRWASRITLEITGVRVERLQEISTVDALAEGVNVHPDHHGKPRSSLYSPVQAYADLWEQINGLESWAANPWVWVIEFKKLEQAL